MKTVLLVLSFVGVSSCAPALQNVPTAVVSNAPQGYTGRYGPGCNCVVNITSDGGR